MDSAPRFPFGSLYRHGFVRVAAASVPVVLADPAANAQRVAAVVRDLSARGVAVAVFPELGLSGYAIEDLRQQEVLLDAAEAAIATLAQATAALLPLVLVGAPLRHRDRLFNCAVAIHRGRILGVVPKAHLPNYREFYEARHFAPGAGVRGETITVAGQAVPFGVDLVFAASDLPGLTVHAEICEDVWMPVPPSSLAALAGANVLANLSASNITVGKAEERSLLCRAQSQRCLAAYLYAAAGAGESSTDVAWDGQVSIFENGELLAETERFPVAEAVAVADVDVAGLARERMTWNSLETNRAFAAGPAFRRIPFRVDLAGHRSRARPPRRALPVRAGELRAPRAGLLRGLQHPGLGADPAPRGRACEARGDRHLGRARQHPGAAGGGPGRSTSSAARAPTSWPGPCRASAPPTTRAATPWR